MADPRFYTRGGPFSLDTLAQKLGAQLADGADPKSQVSDVASLEAAGSGDLSYCADKRYKSALQTTRAGACLVSDALRAEAPSGTQCLVVANPAVAYAHAAALFYPAVRRPAAIDATAHIDPHARLAADVTVEPGAVIGARVEIGPRTLIGANAVIGRGCAIGADCVIGPGVSISHSLLGDRVILHGGVRLGQDGFGYAMGPHGHTRIPQLGRVVVQDDVEIGANTAVDRGAAGDTVIGEGTKIDNLVQIGHNVKIGRGCVIAGRAGISGSVVLGDFVVIGGAAGIADHVVVSASARIAAFAGVMRDVSAGQIVAGAPARPIKTFMKEVAALGRLARGRRQGNE